MTEKNKSKFLTVAELIEELKKAPQDAKVFTEGCDCYGDVGSVEIDKNGKEVGLMRTSPNDH